MEYYKVPRIYLTTCLKIHTKKIIQVLKDIPNDKLLKQICMNEKAFFLKKVNFLPIDLKVQHNRKENHHRICGKF